ncbi:MAG: RNA polymerase sigma factor [Planctomycetes bacterium]|nr:RNA polymerase sigma factor [Planctomycetota bacterium]
MNVLYSCYKNYTPSRDMRRSNHCPRPTGRGRFFPEFTPPCPVSFASWVMETMSLTREEALIELMRTHQRHIWRYLRALGCDDALADDLTQEVFIKVYDSAFEDVAFVSSAVYLRTAARHALFNLRKRQGREQPLGDDYEAAWTTLTPGEDSDERLNLLLRCLDALPERGRKAVQMFYREQRDQATIAGAMGSSEEAVKALLKRTRQELRDCIEKHRST